MKTDIAANIRRFRKERKMTQEQLSVVLGVTVGAVSKWEAGMYVPDITTIMELAAFFGTSVDVLIGYDLQSDSMERAAERIDELRDAKAYDEATLLSEKALMNHPNAFLIAYHCALMYAMKGMERRDQKASHRALELYTRALELFPQNADHQISEWAIRNKIAYIYLGLDQPRRGVELLKQNNASGMNDSGIGFILAKDPGTAAEALPFLSNAIIQNLCLTFDNATGYANAYCHLKRYADAEHILLWALAALRAFREDGAVSNLDKMCVRLLTHCAVVAALRGDPDATRDYLRRARQSALEFDKTPVYAYRGRHILERETERVGFDNFGATALAGVVAALDAFRDLDAARVMRQAWLDIGGESASAQSDQKFP